MPTALRLAFRLHTQLGNGLRYVSPSSTMSDQLLRYVSPSSSDPVSSINCCITYRHPAVILLSTASSSGPTPRGSSYVQIYITNIVQRVPPP
ncbi:unnamed protein product [Linum trigynum]|uniref:Uncharacterized protein n=1 Tax=Linum trigynum TaxID=586398 RepID=A0AAV2E7N6_9ROSI